ncbi:hypothetical protein BFINE_22290 [Bacteroides finegoldii DSM 17565]|nr:hypothetical protein BFINE_22290 [Bacteroides finegoldii DSM 17565]
MRNGYMNIHEQPFTYFNELLPYAKEFEKVTQVKSAGEFDTGKFKRLSTEIRKAADGILKRDFDVRGHRSLENMLNDSTVTFTVGSRKLNEVQKTALASDTHCISRKTTRRRQGISARPTLSRAELRVPPSPSASGHT